LKIKYHDFKLVTRSQSFPEGVDDKKVIAETAKKLLLAAEAENKKIRLLGISLSNFGETNPRQNEEHSSDQLKLF
jgi:DNA polymerase-4